MNSRTLYISISLLCAFILMNANCTENLCERFPQDERCLLIMNNQSDMAVPQLSITISPKRLDLMSGGQLKVTVPGSTLQTPPTYSLKQNAQEIQGATTIAGTNTFSIALSSSELAGFASGTAMLSINIPGQMASSPIFLFSTPTWGSTSGASPPTDNLSWIGVTSNQGILLYSNNGSGMNSFSFYTLQGNTITAAQSMLPSGLAGVSFPSNTVPTVDSTNLFVLLDSSPGSTYRICSDLSGYVCQAPTGSVNLPITSRTEVTVERNDKYIASIGKDTSGTTAYFVHAVNAKATMLDQRFIAATLIGTTVANAQHTAFLDLDNDGQPDLIIIDTSGKPYVFINMNSIFTYNDSLSTAMASVINGTAVVAVAVDDYDGDGFADLAVARDTKVEIYSNQLDGTIIANGSFTAPSTIVSLNSGDINGDSRPDIVFVTSTAIPRTINARLNMHK